MLSVCFNFCILQYQILKEYQILSFSFYHKSFTDQYNWKEIDFPTRLNSWKKFESNNKSIALNILYVPYNTKEMRHAYQSKYNLKRENHVILLMITDSEKWHYLAVKKLPALFRGITSKHVGDFYCLNCFRSYRTKYIKKT